MPSSLEILEILGTYFWKLNGYFCFVASLPSNGCEPGWYKANKSCHLFYFQTSRQWGDARTICHLFGAELAVVNDARTVQNLANQRKELNLDDRDLYLGLSGELKWIWLDGSVVTNSTPNQWGPNEPSGDGKCGAFLNAIRWDSNWKGYGWRWNDIPCTIRKGYICQQLLGTLTRYCYVIGRMRSLHDKCAGLVTMVTDSSTPSCYYLVC